jgi:hypothetical protein
MTAPRTMTGLILRTGWLLACLAVLLGFLMFEGDANAQRYLFWTMLAFCFPLGLLVYPFTIVTMFLVRMIPVIGSLFEFLTGKNDYLVVWFWLFVFGFVQWFLLVPGIVRLFKRLFSSQPR